MRPDVLKQHPEILLSPSATLRDAMQAMTTTRIGITLVVDAERRLLGIVNDIDIRRCLLRGGGMDTCVDSFMNRDPLVMKPNLSDADIAEFYRSHPKSQIPVVDKDGRLCALTDMRDYTTIPQHFSNRVVIMAGGLGQRLGALTANTPKPMLPLGGKPILEVLLEQFKESGFTRFSFAVNYLADRVMEHFQDGSAWGVKVDYLREDKPLGTIGALSLVRDIPEEPVLVANGDILTKVNFQALLNFHTSEGASATLCVKPHDVQLPFGVVEMDGPHLRRFTEKPVQRSYINAGIYVLQPEALGWIPKDTRYDMPQLIADIQGRRQKGVACFPIQEYWMDIGEAQSYRRASTDYGNNFE